MEEYLPGKTKQKIIHLAAYYPKKHNDDSRKALPAAAEHGAARGVVGFGLNGDHDAALTGGR